jgi:hypothetical protein
MERLVQHEISLKSAYRDSNGSIESEYGDTQSSAAVFPARANTIWAVTSTSVIQLRLGLKVEFNGPANLLKLNGP